MLVIPGAFAKSKTDPHSEGGTAIEKLATKTGLAEELGPDGKSAIQALIQSFDPGTPLTAFQKLLNIFSKYSPKKNSNWFPIQKLCDFWSDLSKTPPFNSPTNLEWRAFLAGNKAFIDKILYGNHPPDPASCGRGYLRGVHVVEDPGTRNSKKIKLILNPLDSKDKQEAPILENPVTKARYRLENPSMEPCPSGNPRILEEKCWMMAFRLEENSERALKDLEIYSWDGNARSTNLFHIRQDKGLYKRYQKSYDEKLASAQKGFSMAIEAVEKNPENPEKLKALNEAQKKYLSAREFLVNIQSDSAREKAEAARKAGTPPKSYLIVPDPDVHPENQSKNSIITEADSSWRTPAFRIIRTSVFENPDGSNFLITLRGRNRNRTTPDYLGEGTGPTN